MPVCSKCGAELPNDAKFCFSCGAPQHTADEKEFFFIRNEKEPSNAEGSFTDPRDGEVYKTCKIGDQIWMAENLRYRPPKGGSYPYDKNKDNVAKYGRLYEWRAVEEAVPPGWLLPSEEDVEQLNSFVEKNYDVFDALRSEDWDDGLDVYGFNAVPSGYQGYENSLYDSRDEWDNNSSGFHELNERAVYWADEGMLFSIDSDSCSNNSVYVKDNPNISYRKSGWVDTAFNKYEACAIRCIKNTPQRLLRLKEAIDQKRKKAEEARKAEEESRTAEEEESRRRHAEWEADRKREQEYAEQHPIEMRVRAIKNVVSGVGFKGILVGVITAAAFMYLSQNLIASIILGIGYMWCCREVEDFKAVLGFYIVSAVCCLLLALLVSTFSSLTFATFFSYSFVIGTPIVVYWGRR